MDFLTDVHTPEPAISRGIGELHEILGQGSGFFEIVERRLALLVHAIRQSLCFGSVRLWHVRYLVLDPLGLGDQPERSDLFLLAALRELPFHKGFRKNPLLVLGYVFQPIQYCHIPEGYGQGASGKVSGVFDLTEDDPPDLFGDVLALFQVSHLRCLTPGPKGFEPTFTKDMLQVDAGNIAAKVLHVCFFVQKSTVHQLPPDLDDLVLDGKGRLLRVNILDSRLLEADVGFGPVFVHSLGIVLAKTLQGVVHLPRHIFSRVDLAKGQITANKVV